MPGAVARGDTSAQAVPLPRVQNSSRRRVRRGNAFNLDITHNYCGRNQHSLSDLVEV